MVCPAFLDGLNCPSSTNRAEILLGDPLGGSKGEGTTEDLFEGTREELV